VKPPDDATSTKTKEAAKRERTEEEIDADQALLQGAANTLDPKSRARSTNQPSRGRGELQVRAASPQKVPGLNRLWTKVRQVRETVRILSISAPTIPYFFSKIFFQKTFRKNASLPSPLPLNQ